MKLPLLTLSSPSKWNDISKRMVIRKGKKNDNMLKISKRMTCDDQINEYTYKPGLITAKTIPVDKPIMVDGANKLGNQL